MAANNLVCSKERHGAGQCTRSKGFDKSKLRIEIGMFAVALDTVSNTKFFKPHPSVNRVRSLDKEGTAVPLK